MLKERAKLVPWIADSTADSHLHTSANNTISHLLQRGYRRFSKRTELRHRRHCVCNKFAGHGVRVVVSTRAASYFYRKRASQFLTARKNVHSFGILVSIVFFFILSVLKSLGCGKDYLKMWPGAYYYFLHRSWAMLIDLSFNYTYQTYFCKKSWV